MKLVVVGVRPNFIHLKGFFLFEDRNDYRILNTYQHYDSIVNEDIRKELELPKEDYRFPPVMWYGDNVRSMNLFSIIVHNMYNIISKEKIDSVYVIGDTYSAYYMSIICNLLGVNLVHIESGLRISYPTPEELNRRVIDILSNVCLAPEPYAVRTLKKEKVYGKIVKTPNYKLEAFKYYLSKINENHRHKEEYGILTLHRQENVDNKNRLRYILYNLEIDGMPIIFPIHHRTKKRLNEFNLKLPSNIEVIEPVTYLQMVNLLYHSKRVYTDSGGLSLQAYELRKDLVIFRKDIEWQHIKAQFIP
jgi:UDP-N-acetylglucosamine 2-epimerase